jgi:hypothetical protein
MPDPLSQWMNAQLREAAGRGVTDLGQPPRTAAADQEPPAEPHVSMDKWVAWARTVEHRFDAHGRLPGEPDYDPTSRQRPGFSSATGWERRAHRWLARRKANRTRA